MRQGKLTPAKILPAHVRLTRQAPRQLDTDNLSSSFKAMRDGVADALGIDDGSGLISWCYDQQKRKQYGVLIAVGWGPDE